MIRFALGLIVLVGALGLLAGCGGDDDESAPAETTTETATTGDETTTDDTGTGETETGEAETGDAANGEAVFASAGCGSCHTLSKAGTSGTVGPNLDDTTLSFDEVTVAAHVAGPSELISEVVLGGAPPRCRSRCAA